MTYATTFRLILLILISVIFSNCCSKNSTTQTKPVSTGDPTCDYAIKSFNENASVLIIRDIRKIYSNRGSIPENLKQLYPAARNAWNTALSDVKNRYTNSYTVGSLNGLTTAVVEEWGNKNLEDYQKFFLLLTEYSWGVYPKQTIDLEKKAGWLEKGDVKRRFEAGLKPLTEDCHSRDIDLVKKLIAPKFLPENIEDCYK